MKFGYSLLLCVVSATQLPVLLLLILTSYCPDSASGLPFADDVQSSDAVTLVQPSVSSLLQTTLAPRVVQRRPCDPRTVRNLRKQLKNKAKTIRKLRLALREKKSGKKSDVQTTHHKSHYCFSVKKNSKRIKTYSSLVPAIRKKVIHLEKEIKSLQRWYKKQPGVDHALRDIAPGEVNRLTELLLPNWNASDSQSLSENLNTFRDGLIIFGSAVHQMSQNKELNKAVAGKLKHLQRSHHNRHHGIYPLLKNVYKFAASLNVTLPQSRLCTGTEQRLREKIEALEAGSKDSPCGDRKNQIGRNCRSYGFFTFVRRFLVHLGQLVTRPPSSADSASM